MLNIPWTNPRFILYPDAYDVERFAHISTPEWVKRPDSLFQCNGETLCGSGASRTKCDGRHAVQAGEGARLGEGGDGVMRIFSSGGGVQSIAALVLSAQGVIDYPVHLFANTGDDSENPATMDYVRNVAMPYARAHGIEFVELHRTFKRGAMRGQVETLYGRIYRTKKSIPIPIYAKSGFPMSRACTVNFKIDVVLAWLKAHGASAKNPAHTGIGFSLDEWSRVKPSLDDVQILEFPLIDLRLTRTDCQNVITDAGLPLPHKSACWFCPVTSHAEWVRMANEQPEQFERACQLEAHLSQKYGEPLFLHKQRLNLREAVKQFYFDLDDTMECTGYCLT